MAWAVAVPDMWLNLTEDDRSRSIHDDDLCVIKQDERVDYFIKGNIEIPIHGLGDPLTFGVWSSLSRVSFERTAELWETKGRESEPPYFGWLSNELAPVYPNTLNLKLNVSTSPVGLRPTIRLEPTDHPMARDQREGVSLERVREIARLMLHGNAA